MQQSSSSDPSHNISNYAHQIASLVSSPCSTNKYCQALTTFVIPTCERLNEAAGCWCGNLEVFHHCSACASSSTHNRTTPTHVEDTTNSFKGLNESCSVYEQTMQNSTIPTAGPPVQAASASPTMGISASGRSTHDNIPSTSGERKEPPVGAIIGVVLGALFGLLVVFGGARFLARLIRKSRSKQLSRRNYYYKSIEYSSEGSMDRHRLRTVYNSPYECVTSHPIPDTRPDSTYVIISAESPASGFTSLPPYQPPAHQSRGDQSDEFNTL